MSIRPIDIATVAPKSQEASQVQFNDLRGREHVGTNINHEFHKTEQHDRHRTVQATKGESKEYRYDAKEGGSNSYHGKKQKKKDENQSPEQKTKKAIRDTYASEFDIKI